MGSLSKNFPKSVLGRKANKNANQIFINTVDTCEIYSLKHLSIVKVK